MDPRRKFTLQCLRMWTAGFSCKGKQVQDITRTPDSGARDVGMGGNAVLYTSCMPSSALDATCQGASRDGHPARSDTPAARASLQLVCTGVSTGHYGPPWLHASNIGVGVFARKFHGHA